MIVYLEQKVYYIVNTLLSPMYRTIALGLKTQDRPCEPISIGVLLQLVGHFLVTFNSFWSFISKMRPKITDLITIHSPLSTGGT